jgi:hypothetical protein
MAAGSSMQATSTMARPTQATASVTALNRRSTPLPVPRHLAWPAAYAKVALLTMHAHRLWIKLWITLGHPEENSNRPEGNARVKPWRTPATHSHPGQSTTASHSQCAQSQRTLAGRIVVIPGIHRPYDDYQSCIDRQIHIKVGKRPTVAGAPRRRYAAPLTPLRLRAETVPRYPTR